MITAALTAAISMTSTAEQLIDVYAGVDYRTMESEFTENDSTNLAGYIAFEHFIPLMPNVKFKSAYLNGSSEGHSATNTILYYKFFDNGLIEANAGVAYTNIKSATDEASIPQTYLAGRLYIPNTSFNVFGEMIQGSIVSDGSSHFEMGASYRFVPRYLLIDVALRAGYHSRTVNFASSASDRVTEGLFMGVETHF